MSSPSSSQLLFPPSSLLRPSSPVLLLDAVRAGIPKSKHPTFTESASLFGTAVYFQQFGRIALFNVPLPSHFATATVADVDDLDEVAHADPDLASETGRCVYVCVVRFEDFWWCWRLLMTRVVW